MSANDLQEVFKGIVEGQLEQSAWSEALQKQTDRPKMDNLRLISKVRKIPVEVLVDLPVILCKLAFVQPQSTVDTLDKVANAWQEKWTIPLPQLPHRVHELPERLWQLFWEHLDTPEVSKILEVAAKYSTYLNPQLRAEYTQEMLDRPGARQVMLENFQRASFTLESLSIYPEGSFGYAFYHQMVDNNLSLETLDINKYTWLNPQTEFIGKRALQTHDIWHVVLGYGVKSYEEVALQAVNLAQTGGAFPAYLLAMLIARSLFYSPSQLPYLLDVILQGWQHGRQTPPLLPIHWEEL